MARDRGNDAKSPDWDATVNQAVDHLEESDMEVAEARERRDRGKAWGYLFVALPLLLAVLAWNAWLATRAPVVPPDDRVALALRENASALIQEVEAFRRAQGRLPTPDEMGHLTDAELTYSTEGSSYVITNTDGVVRVRYDGAMAVERWVAAGAFTVVEGQP